MAALERIGRLKRRRACLSCARRRGAHFPPVAPDAQSLPPRSPTARACAGPPPPRGGRGGHKFPPRWSLSVGVLHTSRAPRCETVPRLSLASDAAAQGTWFTAGAQKALIG